MKKQETYKWNPEEYQRSSVNQKKWGEELLSRINFRGNEIVLDVGCGGGVLTASLAQKVPQGLVIGIDSSEEMIALARQKFPRTIYPNLTFLVKDVREINFEEEFDLIYSNACLHWVLDHLAVLQRFHRALKPSGKIFLQMGGRGNAATVIKILEKLIISPKWNYFFENFSFPYGFYGPEEYQIWLKKTGFKPKRVELFSKEMIHEDKAKFASWIRSTWLPYTHRVPEEKRKDFIREVVTLYLRDYPPDENGIIRVPMVRLEVEAGKS